MRVIRVDDVDAYLALVGPFLRAREAEHNLALGLLGRLRVEPRLYGFDPTFVVVEDRPARSSAACSGLRPTASCSAASRISRAWMPSPPR